MDFIKIFETFAFPTAAAISAAVVLMYVIRSYFQFLRSLITEMKVQNTDIQNKLFQQTEKLIHVLTENMRVNRLILNIANKMKNHGTKKSD